MRGGINSKIWLCVDLPNTVVHVVRETKFVKRNKTNKQTNKQTNWGLSVASGHRPPRNQRTVLIVSGVSPMPVESLTMHASPTLRFGLNPKWSCFRKFLLSRRNVSLDALIRFIRLDMHDRRETGRYEEAAGFSKFWNWWLRVSSTW